MHREDTATGATHDHPQGHEATPVSRAVGPDSAVVVIADDHPLFRGALAQALGMGETGNATDVREAQDFVTLERMLESAGDIDLVLLDLSMPGTSGLSGLLSLRARYPHMPVVIVSASDDAATINRALSLGASGFIPKSCDIATMRAAIASVLAGDIWKPVGIEDEAEGDEDMADLLERLSTLTPQQMRVLSMLARGLLNKQIAYELSVSEATVKAHVSAVLSKLDVDSRTQAVIRLSRLGSDALVTPPTDV